MINDLKCAAAHGRADTMQRHGPDGAFWRMVIAISMPADRTVAVGNIALMRGAMIDFEFTQAVIGGAQVTVWFSQAQLRCQCLYGRTVNIFWLATSIDGHVGIANAHGQGVTFVSAELQWVGDLDAEIFNCSTITRKAFVPPA